MNFKIVGTNEPMLLVELSQGDKIYCDANSMITMDSNLELEAKVNGKFFNAFLKKLLNEKSFFNQYVEAKIGNGDVLLAPKLPSDINILEINDNEQFYINDGAFLAATKDVNISIKPQKIKTAFWSKNGGLFISKTSGFGLLALSGFGTIYKKSVSKDKPIIVDNGYVVAWSQGLEHNATFKTNRNGVFTNLINSVKSGEGIVSKFSGDGVVYICSRDKNYYVNWMRFMTSIRK